MIDQVWHCGFKGFSVVNDELADLRPELCWEVEEAEWLAVASAWYVEVVVAGSGYLVLKSGITRDMVGRDGHDGGRENCQCGRCCWKVEVTAGKREEQVDVSQARQNPFAAISHGNRLLAVSGT